MVLEQLLCNDLFGHSLPFYFGYFPYHHLWALRIDNNIVKNMLGEKKWN